MLIDLKTVKKNDAEKIKQMEIKIRGLYTANSQLKTQKVHPFQR